jgi:hypothetical protein
MQGFSENFPTKNQPAKTEKSAHPINIPRRGECVRGLVIARDKGGAARGGCRAG